MAQDQVIIRRSGHQILDELDAADIPDLSAVYDVAGAAASAQSAAASDATTKANAAQAAAIAASQPVDSDLTAFAGLAIAADKLPYGTGSHTLGLADFTAAARTFLVGASETDQRNALFLGTSDSPQFSSLEIGHPSNTTITRLSAGDIGVEGNRLYRAGGTDVPVADGGTGASTAADARTALGLVIGTDVRAQGSGDPVVPTDATIATTDVTTNNVSTTKHGWAPKAPNDATKFLDGTGAYTVPSGTGFANPMTTAADLIVGGTAGAAARLAKGSDGQVLTVDPSTHLLVWATPASAPPAAWPSIPLKLSAQINFDWSHMQMVANPGAATRTVSGMLGGPANSGTVTSGDDADGAWQLLTTAATSNNEATMYTATMFRRDWGAIASGVFKTPAAFAVGVWEAGFSSAGLGTAAVPATHCAIFRYSTAVDGTAFWRTVTNNAGTGTVTATSVAVAVSTVYRWVIRLLPSSVEYYLATADGAFALVDTCSATLPTATTPLTIVTRALTLENVAKTILWGRYTILTRP